MSNQGDSRGYSGLKGGEAEELPSNDKAAIMGGIDESSSSASTTRRTSPRESAAAALDRAGRRPSNEDPSNRPAPPPSKRLKSDPNEDDEAVPTTADASGTAATSSPAAAAGSQPTPDMASEEGGVNQAASSSSVPLGPVTREATDDDSAGSSHKHAALQRASSVGSVSDFSTASAAAAATAMSSRDDDISSPTFGRGAGKDDDEDGASCASEFPAAPPTTPLSHASSSSSSLMINWDGLATPLPVLGTSAIRNASRLVEEQKRQWHDHRLRQQEMLLQDGAMTPLPDYRARKRDDDDGGGESSSSFGFGGSEGDVGSDKGGLSESNASASADSEGGAATAAGKPPQHLPDDFSEWAVGDRYELVRMLGRGSYGEVAQAIDLSVGRRDAFVAIKRVQSPFDQEIDAIRLYREIHILRRMRGHECIIQLLDIVQPPTDDLDDFHDLYMVFEYVDTDLYKLIMSPQYLTTEHIQTFLYQMLVALKYIHSLSVIHRDLKPANILLNEDCSLKICDFGLARIVDKATMVLTSSQDGQKPTDGAVPPRSPPVLFGNPPKTGLTRQLTKHVVTRWYRAPELILIQPYTSAVDIWSVGCILAELLSMQDGNVPSYQDRKPIFPGGFCFPLSGEGEKVKKDERMDQLNVIFKVIGTPSEEDIDAVGKASEYIRSLGKLEGVSFQKLFPVADPAALDLLRQMLHFNPSKRCTADEALNHEFFTAIRRLDFERTAEGPLQGPDFLETQRVDLRVLKQKTYEEVRWFRDHAAPSGTRNS